MERGKQLHDCPGVWSDRGRCMEEDGQVWAIRQLAAGLTPGMGGLSMRDDRSRPSSQSPRTVTETGLKGQDPGQPQTKPAGWEAPRLPRRSRSSSSDSRQGRKRCSRAACRYRYPGFPLPGYTDARLRKQRPLSHCPHRLLAAQPARLYP